MGEEAEKSAQTGAGGGRSTSDRSTIHSIYADGRSPDDVIFSKVPAPEDDTAANAAPTMAPIHVTAIARLGTSGPQLLLVHAWRLLSC